MRQRLDLAQEVRGPTEFRRQGLVVRASGSPAQDAPLEGPEHVASHAATAPGHLRQHTDATDPFGAAPEHPADLVVIHAVGSQSQHTALEGSEGEIGHGCHLLIAGRARLARGHAPCLSWAARSSPPAGFDVQ